PLGWGETLHRPSLSKPKMSLAELRGRVVTVELELFWTPTSVSSAPSYGPTVGSSNTDTLLSGLMTMSTAQLGDVPTGGHWVNGGVGAAEAGGAETTTEAAEGRTKAKRNTTHLAATPFVWLMLIL